MGVKPIRPNEVQVLKAKAFPDAVFETFNEMISEKYTGGSVTLRQDDIVKRMVKKGLKTKDIFAKGWLDVEDSYRKAGWSVEYDEPAYNETYEATFTFRKK